MPVTKPQPQVSTLAADSPSQKLIKQNRPTKTVTDENGREIVWRTMSILEQARIYRSVGAAHSSNVAYMNLVNVAAAVVSIDGEIGPQPTSLAFIDDRIKWVGDEGYAAILDAVMKEAEAADAEPVTEQSFRDDVKNS